MRAVEEGLDATLFFVIQMENICAMSPNDKTHPAFGAALRRLRKPVWGFVRECAQWNRTRWSWPDRYR